MFYVHTSRFGPRPPPPGGLNGPRLPPFPDQIGNFTRFTTFSEFSSHTSFTTNYPLRPQRREDPYVTTPTDTPSESVAAESRAESPSSVFHIESIPASSVPQTPGLLSPVDDLLATPRASFSVIEKDGDSTPRASTPIENEINREFEQFEEVDDLISDLDASARLAKEYDKLEPIDDLLEPLHSPKKFYSTLELSEESRQKHEYLSRAPPLESLIMSSNSAFSAYPSAEQVVSQSSLCSSYATPYTSAHTIYYSAEDNLHLQSEGIRTPIPMEKEKNPEKENITTSRVITETVSMVTTGIITPPPGRIPSPEESIALTESFEDSEVISSIDNASDGEELEQFSRSQTVRRSILPGQRKHPPLLGNSREEELSTPSISEGRGTPSEGIAIPKVLEETRAPSVISTDEEVKEYPKVRVETPPSIEEQKEFPKVVIPENPEFSPDPIPIPIYDTVPDAVYDEVPKAAPIPQEERWKEPESVPQPPPPKEAPPKKPREYIFVPSSSYILEETTTTERVEETTTESFSETQDYHNFKTRSPLHNKHYYGHHVPIIRRDPHGGRVLKMVTEMGSATIGGISPALSANAAKSFLEATDKEKKELQGLNDRLGNYIDRVKRLEEQNRKLVADLDELRGKWGKDTSEIKIKYSESLSTARKDIDDSARRKAEIDVKAARLRDDLAEYRSRYEDVQHRREADREKISQWTNAIADAQSELEMLRARWKQLTDEEKRLNTDNARIWEELQKARNDLDEETIGRIDFQNQVQTLMEELEFLRRVHEQEVKELQALLAQAPADTREFFKNELALAIRDIKDEYDYIAKQGKQDMESWYKLKVSEVQGSANRAAMESNYQREEVKRMRDNIGDLRGKLGDLENKNALLEKEVQNLNYQLNDDQRQYEMALNDRDATLRRMREECQTLVAELQGLLDTKQMLDAEIAIYRKMLEGEESRVGLRQMVEQVVKTHSLQQQEDTDSTRSVRGEVSTKTTFQRSAKGNVTIAECDPNGKFITLENTHRTKEEPLGEYKLKRKLDGNRREIVYTIPAGVVLKPGKSLKIYARDQGGVHNPPESLVFDGENTWGIGANVVTSLINKEGDERATHTQKTIQTGQ